MKISIDQVLTEFMSDTMYGYRDNAFVNIVLADQMSDLKNVVHAANGMEKFEDPYVAARYAVRSTERFRLRSEMKIISPAAIADSTISHNKFRAAENAVLLAVEKNPSTRLICCAPRCGNFTIANSHAIQKKRVIEKISDVKHEVFQTKNDAFDGANFMRKIGWRGASTFPGFCHSCEEKLFRDVESSTMILNRRNMATLIWRALCFTRFRRAREVQIRGQLTSRLPMYELAEELDDVLVLANSSLLFKNRIHAFRQLDLWVSKLQKSSFDAESQFSYVTLKMPNLPFVGAGVIPLHFDFNREWIQAPDRFDKDVQSVAYTTCLVDNCLHIVFCARKRQKIASQFCERIVTMDKHLLSAFLPQLLIGSTDTNYVSPDYWTKIATPLDKQIFKHAHTMNFAQMVFPHWGVMTDLEIESVEQY